jgi:hypothetical protein
MVKEKMLNKKRDKRAQMKTSFHQRQKLHGNFSLNAKRAQMKIQQMSFLLIAIFILFALLGMIFVSYYIKTMKDNATDLQEKNAHLLVSKIANSPEFSCGMVYSSSEMTDCVDADKVMTLKENINKYSEFWGVKSIEILKVYPSVYSTGIIKECTNITYPRCNSIKLINSSSSGYGVSNFVSLCRKERYKGEIIDKCELAKLIVRYEEVN